MVSALDRRSIVMNFSTPPSADDLHAVAVSVLDQIPDDLSAFVEDMELYIDEFAEREALDHLDVDNEYDLLALYRATSEKIPGVVDKTGSDDKRLMLYRRPILDLWCDTGEDLTIVMRNVIISEIAQANGFSDEEIENLCALATEAAQI